MGGVKKRPLAAMEKAQQAQDEEEKPKKKEKESKGQAQQKRLPFVTPKLSDQDFLKSLTPLRAITIYAAARSLGVNASIAKGILTSLEAKKLIKRIGGFSGHYVWSTAS